MVPTDVRLDHLDQTLLSDVDLVNSKSDVSMTAFGDQLTSFGTESVIISRNVIARTVVESCSKCLRTFTSETERKKHVCEEMSCEACREEFSSKSDYLEHLNKVHRKVAIHFAFGFVIFEPVMFFLYSEYFHSLTRQGWDFEQSKLILKPISVAIIDHYTPNMGCKNRFLKTKYLPALFSG